jgi:hypothetical protein
MRLNTIVSPFVKLCKYFSYSSLQLQTGQWAVYGLGIERNALHECIGVNIMRRFTRRADAAPYRPPLLRTNGPREKSLI